MTSKSQRNEDGGQEKEILGEKEEGSDTSQLDEKIIEVEAGLLALNRRLVVVENNFSSLEMVALEGLDEVKSNLVELEEVNKEGMTNLELKLIETLSSLHKKFETLKRQVDETVNTGVVGLVTIRETRIDAPKPKDFRDVANGRDNRSKNVPPKVDNNRNKGKSVPNRGSDARCINRNQPSNFRKKYEDRKKGATHREGCYICGETTHAARYCLSLSKLNAMVAAQKQ
ncbi:hypothetical protein H5410_006796 [Solanum commersonii]|uniref:CCHC-type domain-containing protein n=1 Tax=Solanum commersonii TaxID=4109 RepID=A0A9J6ABJ8_SOLCO|nr:hypothetical protein H5410_006796 [Solanum commersonii]